MSIEVEKVLFIVTASLAGAFVLLMFLYPAIKKFLYKHATVASYYHKVRRVTLDNDFLLINRFSNLTAEEQLFHIDHIMIGDKYIYCIRDRYYDGCVKGSPQDEKWLYWRKDKKKEIANPMAMNKKRIERLALMSGTPDDVFVSIILVNDDCFLGSDLDDGDNSYIVSLSKFPSLVQSLESRDIGVLDPERSAMFAKDIDAINLTDAN